MAINYQKVPWVKGSTLGPTNFNRMENGIKDACDGVDANTGEIDNINESSVVDNLTPYPYYDYPNLDNNGISFIVNDDYSITANGTATGGNAVFRININSATSLRKLVAGRTYTLSGCPSGGSTSKYCMRMYFYDADGNASPTQPNTTDVGNGVTFVAEEGYEYFIIYLRVISGYVAENLTFYPMLEEGNTSHKYRLPSNARPVLRNDIDNVLNGYADNLIKFPYISTDGRQQYGITFNVDSKGVVTANGTATGNATFYLTSTTYASENALELEPDTEYTMSCEGNTSNAYFAIQQLQPNGTRVTYKNTSLGRPVIFRTVNDASMKYLAILYIRTGAVLDNMKFKPMLEIGTIAHKPTEYKYSRQALRKDIDALIALMGAATTGVEE